MKERQWLRMFGVLIMIATILAAVVTACTSKPTPSPAPTPSPSPTVSPAPAPAPAPSPTPAPSPKPAAPTGPRGDLKIALSSFGLERINPALADSTTRLSLLSPMFDWMLRTEGRFKLAPSVVEKWEMAPDGRSWTYYIRKGIKFHNGDDLTAEDVKFSFEQMASPKAPRGEMREMLDRVELIDNYTVRIFTKKSEVYLPYYTGLFSPTHGVVIPKKYFEKVGPEAFEKNPVGSGPFKFVRYVPGDRIEYEAVEQHWRQTPAFKNLTIMLVPEEATRVAMLKTGAVDIIDIGMEAAEDLKKAGFRTAVRDEVHLMVTIPGAYDPKTAKMPTHDVRVRKALSLAIDRNEIGKTFFNGMLSPSMPPGVSKGTVGLDTKYWMDYSANNFRYDPEEAKRLLKEAGYPDGFTIKFFSHNLVSYFPDLTKIVAGYWSRIGVKTEIVAMDWGAYSPIRVADHVIGNASLLRLTEDIVPRYIMTILDTKSTWKGFLGADPQFDALLRDMVGSLDPTVREDALKKSVKMVADSYTLLMIGDAPALIGMGPKVDVDVSAEYPKEITSLADRMKHRQ